MMRNLVNRAESVARAEQRRQLLRIAARTRELVRDAAIEVEEARILVRGRGIVKRWLIDPSLRFLSSGLR
jgi:hypothetical protein